MFDLVYKVLDGLVWLAAKMVQTVERSITRQEREGRRRWRDPLIEALLPMAERTVTVVERLKNAVRKLIAWPEIISAAALPLLGGFLASVFSDFGRDVHLAMYSAVTSLLPILLIAALVEYSLLLPVALGEAEWEDEKEEREVGRAVATQIIYRAVGYLAIGECAALYALGANESTTFLAVTALICAAVLVIDLAKTHISRYSPEVRRRAATRSPSAARSKGQQEPRA